MASQTDKTKEKVQGYLERIGERIMLTRHFLLLKFPVNFHSSTCHSFKPPYAIEFSQKNFGAFAPAMGKLIENLQSMLPRP